MSSAGSRLGSLVLIVIGLAAGMTHASRADAAIRWDWTGTHECPGTIVKTYAPTVGSSGWIAWLPVAYNGRGNFVSGQYRYAYQNSAWEFQNGNPSGITWQDLNMPIRDGSSWYVINWIYDFDTRSWNYGYSHGTYRIAPDFTQLWYTGNPWCYPS